jgi:hypothetical protein
MRETEPSDVRGEVHVADLWSSFAHDPRERANAALRASDADRERITGVLSSAFADGRIERDELDERMDRLGSARTLGELPPLVSDLVPLKSQPTRPSKSLVGVPPEEMHRWAVERWNDQRSSAVFTVLGTSVVFWGIWLGFDSRGGFVTIPLIVTALAMLHLIRVVTGRDQMVRDEVRRLEKKQARQHRWPKGLP